MKNFNITLMSVMIFSSSLLHAAKTTIATALVVKGDVSFLHPGAYKAKKLKRGDKLAKDTSIYVKGKGFAKIKFINSSSMVVGPNSKVVVEMDMKDKTTLVKLLSGKMRAKVEKNSKNDKKFLVKTVSASMGVRGTEFQITHSPKIQKTSLLTYEGQVDLKKSKIQGIEKVTANSVKEQVAKIKEDLVNDPTPVKKGDYLRTALSDTVKNQKVKIDPRQFLLLKKDDKLGAQKLKLSKAERREINIESKKLEKEFKKDIENSNGKIKQNLGFIDVDKAVYIPPVSVEKKKYLGRIDTSGKYIPPKSLEVDAEKGLVLKAKASKKLKDFVNKVNEQNQIPDKVRKKSEGVYNRYFDV